MHISYSYNAFGVALAEVLESLLVGLLSYACLCTGWLHRASSVCLQGRKCFVFPFCFSYLLCTFIAVAVACHSHFILLGAAQYVSLG